MTVFAKADATRACAVLSAISILTSSGLAMTPRLDPTDVVRQVRSARSEPSTAGSQRLPDSGEFLIDTSVTLVPALGDQGASAVAFDGADFTVVWQDGRNGNDLNIYGARVTPQGTVLDPVGFIISQSAGNQSSPAIAFDGANFLVVWEDDRSGSGHIYGARVTPQGAVLDSAGLIISQTVDDQYAPALASDGTNFLVVWGDNRTYFGDVYGARVTPAGVVLDPSGIPISTGAGTQSGPSLAFDGANFLVAWEDSRSGSDINIHGTRVTPTGVVLDPAGIVISQAEGYQEFTAVGFGGTSFLVVWRDHRSGSQWDIYGARVTPQGTVLDSVGIAIWQAANYQYYLYSPAVCFDGANFLVAWENNSSGSDWDIYGAHVTPGGTVFDSGPVVSQLEDQTCPRLCCGNGSQMLLVYQGWAGIVGGKGYYNYRIWGKMNPSPAVEEMTEAHIRMTNSGASIVRGVLYLPEASSHKPKATSWLLDVSGRKVLDLMPGANDVRALAPGVYFVREAQAQAQAQAVRKLVLTE
jgi:hypothetical protein